MQLQIGRGIKEVQQRKYKRNMRESLWNFFTVARKRVYFKNHWLKPLFINTLLEKKTWISQNSDPLVKPFLTILPNWLQILQREFSSKSISLNILSAVPPLKSKRGQSAERVFFLSLQVLCNKSPRLHHALTQKSKEYSCNVLKT